MNVTLLSDIAGRVARDIKNADRVTIASVALPSGEIKYVRKRLPATLPKWRDATDADVNLVVDFVLYESLSFSTVSIEKEPVAWEKFWRNAADTHSKTAYLSGGKMGFVKAATIIKYALFGQSSASTIAQAVKALPFLQKPSRRGPRIIRESLIFDDEFQGDDNIETFRELWGALNVRQQLTNSLGIQRLIISLDLASEQSEPLLHLPDYIAGLVHTAHSKADVLSASKVSRPNALRLYALIRRSRKYAEILEPFAYNYHDIFPSLTMLFPGKK